MALPLERGQGQRRARRPRRCSSGSKSHDGGAVLDPAGSRDGPGLDQQGLGERGLARRRRGRRGRRCGWLPVRTIAWRPPVADRPEPGLRGRLYVRHARRAATVRRSPDTRRGRAPARSRCRFRRHRGCPHARRRPCSTDAGGRASRRDSGRSASSCAGPGSRPTSSPASGVVMAGCAAVVDRHRAPLAGPALPRAHRPPRRPRRRRGQGRRHRRAPWRVLRLRGRPRLRRAAARRRRLVPRHHPARPHAAAADGRARRLADHLLRAGQGRVARLQRQGRPHGARRAHHRCSASACCSRPCWSRSSG